MELTRLPLTIHTSPQVRQALQRMRHDYISGGQFVPDVAHLVERIIEDALVEHETQTMGEKP